MGGKREFADLPAYDGFGTKVLVYLCLDHRNTASEP